MTPTLFRLLRHYAGLSQMQLGARLGLTQAAISLYENDAVRVPIEVGEQLVGMLPPRAAVTLGEDLGTILQWVRQ